MSTDMAFTECCVECFGKHGYGEAWLLKLVQVLESRKHYLLGGLLDFASEEDFVKNSVDLASVSCGQLYGFRTRACLVEVEDKI